MQQVPSQHTKGPPSGQPRPTLTRPCSSPEKTSCAAAEPAIARALLTCEECGRSNLGSDGRCVEQIVARAASSSQPHGHSHQMQQNRTAAGTACTHVHQGAARLKGGQLPHAYAALAVVGGHQHAAVLGSEEGGRQGGSI